MELCIREVLAQYSSLEYIRIELIGIRDALQRLLLVMNQIRVKWEHGKHKRTAEQKQLSYMKEMVAIGAMIGTMSRFWRRGRKITCFRKRVIKHLVHEEYK